MKKHLYYLLFLLIALMLFGCSGKQNENGETVAWTPGKADMNLVGTWKVESEDISEYYIFTEDCKIKVARGNVYLEGNVDYGVDKDGTAMYKSDFYYMYGEFSYNISGDTVTFTDPAGVMKLMKKTEYTAPELKAYKDFDSKNPLVGTWYNEEFKDTYVFTDDGKVSYNCEMTDYACVAYSDYVYNVVGDSIMFSYDAGNGVEEFTSEFEIKDGVLRIDDAGGYVRQ